MLLLHSFPQAVRFAETVTVRLDSGVQIRESLKISPQPVYRVSRRKIASYDIEVSHSSTKAFDVVDSEDEELRLYMENVPCDRDLGSSALPSQAMDATSFSNH